MGKVAAVWVFTHPSWEIMPAINNSNHSDLPLYNIRMSIDMIGVKDFQHCYWASYRILGNVRLQKQSGFFSRMWAVFNLGTFHEEI